MFISQAQLATSLQSLRAIHPFFGMSLLGFKKSKLPVGTTRPLNFSQVADSILERHYRPCSTHAGYYTPFLTSRKSDRWLSPRYGSTSLQRITTDTFRDALLHPSEQQWGWCKSYLSGLKKHLSRKLIPAFDLATWLFREKDWPRSVTPQDIIEHLVQEYNIEPAEFRALFDGKPPLPFDGWLSKSPISETELLDLIGPPPGRRTRGDAALRRLELKGVGPAAVMNYEPSDRLNIITGDNSLGKTFLLDCIWWALTGQWVSEIARPRPDSPKRHPIIRGNAISS